MCPETLQKCYDLKLPNNFKRKNEKQVSNQIKITTVMTSIN